MSILALLNVCRSVEIITKVDGQDAARVGEKKFLLGFAIEGVFYLSACVHAGLAYYTGVSASYVHYEGIREIRALQSFTNVCTKILNVNSERPTRRLAEAVLQNHVPIILCLCGWVSNWVVLVIRVHFFEADGGEHKKYNVPMNIGEFVFVPAYCAILHSFLSICNMHPNRLTHLKNTSFTGSENW